MDDFYRELIVEHYKNPAYKGTLDPNDFTYEDENPLCGDHIRVDLRVDENRSLRKLFLAGMDVPYRKQVLIC